jgi:hypothetical protein
MSKPEAVMFEEVRLALNEPQSKKVISGGSVQLRHGQMGVGPAIKLHKKNARKLKAAIRSNKGARLKLSPEELMVNGDGLFDVLKQGWKLLKKSGLARDALKLAGKTVLPAIATAFGGPAAGAAVSGVTSKYTDKVVDSVGNVAGFGMRKGVPYRPRGQLSNYSSILSPDNPAMHPSVASVPDQSMARYFPRGVSQSGMLQTGGSFMPAGYRRAGRGFRPAGM